MTGLEALKNICNNCEKEKGKRKVACPFRSISNEYCEEYEEIKKSLKAFETEKTRIVSINRVYNGNTYFYVIGAREVSVGKDKRGHFVIINDKKIYGLSGAEYIGKVEMRKVE